MNACFASLSFFRPIRSLSRCALVLPLLEFVQVWTTVSFSVGKVSRFSLFASDHSCGSSGRMNQLGLFINVDSSAPFLFMKRGKCW